MFSDQLCQRILRTTENAYLALLTAYLFNISLTATTFSFIFPTFLLPSIMMGLFVVAALRFIVLKNDRLIWISAGIAIIYSLVWGEYFLILGLLTMGCVGISYKKVLKTYFLSIGMLVGVTIIAALSDGIVNYVHSNGQIVKSSMGFCNTTDYASLILFLGLALWVYLDRLPYKLTLLIPVLTFLNAYFIAGSRTSSICSALLAGYALLQMFINIKRVTKSARRIINGILDVLFQLVYPVTALFCVGLTYLYYKGFSIAYVLNKISSNRLSVMLNAFKNNNITFFGYQIDEAGNGFSNFGPLKYTFIDISYLRVFFKYGVIIFVVFLILWPTFTRRAIKSNNRRLAFALTLMAIHSASEHHFPELTYNIYLILPFALLDSQKDTVPSPTSGKTYNVHSSQFHTIRAAICMCLVAIEFLLLPNILSWLRVLFINNGNQLYIFGTCLSLLLISVIGIVAAGHLVATLLTERSVPMPAFAAMCCSAIVTVAMALNANTTITELSSKFAGVVAAERGVLQRVLSHQQGELFADKEGELYHRTLQEMSLSIFDGNDLARYKNATIITAKDFDSPVLTSCGFMYAPISSDHAIYSNNKSVIEDLEDEGYVFTTYCTSERAFTFEGNQMSDMPVTADGTLPLGGQASPSFTTNYWYWRNGSTFDLYAGPYVMNFDLSIDPVPYDKDYEVCHLWVTGYNGQKTIRDVAVYRSWFDDKGRLSSDVRFYTSGCPMASFSVSMSEGQSAQLQSIRYRRAPLYDTRHIYDVNHRLLSESYYDARAKPIVSSAGAASIEYDYDNRGLISGITCFDDLRNRVLNKDGYAEVRQSFNAKKQLTREEFFDVAGNPTAHTDGYHAITYVYNERDNVTSVAFFNSDNKPVTTKQGYARVDYAYDEHYRRVGRKYFGVDGKPVELEDGIAGFHYEYRQDDNENPADDPIEYVMFIDRDGSPTANTSGIFGYKRTYNNADQVIADAFVDEQKQPMITDDGCASLAYAYDASNSIWKYRYLNAEGQPTATGQGFAEIQCQHDENGLLIRESYFDAHGKPCVSTRVEGAASVERIYDECHRIVGHVILGIDGQVLREEDKSFALESQRADTIRVIGPTALAPESERQQGSNAAAYDCSSW